MSPLGFDARQMYQFISERSVFHHCCKKLGLKIKFCYRFVNTSADVQKQALQWLQKLCLLEIPVPLDVLFEMLNTGAEALVQVEMKNGHKNNFEHQESICYRVRLTS